MELQCSQGYSGKKTKKTQATPFNAAPVGEPSQVNQNNQPNGSQAPAPAASPSDTSAALTGSEAAAAGPAESRCSPHPCEWNCCVINCATPDF
ncbi:hypothetical protein Ndes2437B_g04844 [Nannochloris sp. 'desiccata']